MLLSRPNHASGQNEDGLGSIWLPSMTRLGSAESGVSMCSLSRFACGFVLIGGAGLANGFGGPDAPAERIVLVDGDGGGSTTPLEFRIGVTPLVGPASLGEESPVALPPSDCSLGICTFNLGRFASACIIFGLGGPDMEDVEAVRWGGVGNCGCICA